MKLMRTAALGAIGKKLYDEAQKPHNKAKIKKAVEQMKARRSGGHGPGGTSSHR
ncbi:MAG TPA: hypothetical protein VFG72_07410 [Marmoricola sp.]|nr:hypothetical protein [Marmoricola sp.]